MKEIQFLKKTTTSTSTKKQAKNYNQDNQVFCLSLHKGFVIQNELKPPTQKILLLQKLFLKTNVATLKNNATNKTQTIFG